MAAVEVIGESTMKLNMTGYDKTAKKYVSADALKKVSNGNSKGYFETEVEYEDASDPIVVKFKNTTYINNTLAGKEKQDVEDHEKRHFTDFKKLAEAMKKGAEKALKAGLDPQIKERVEWLFFDRCVTSAAFHREGGGYSVEICSKPDSKRPA